MKYFIKRSNIKNGKTCYEVTHKNGNVFAKATTLILAEYVCNTLNYEAKTKYDYALCLFGYGVLHNDFLKPSYMKKTKKQWLKDRLEQVLANFERE